MRGADQITAVVLAGGLGTRLREISQDRYPKPMVPVEIGGTRYPFLEFVLGHLRAQGIRDMVLCIGHLGQTVTDHFGDGARFGLRIRYDDAGDADTGARVHSALRLVSGPEFLVACGDVYHPLAVTPFLQRLRDRPDWQVLLSATDAAEPAPNVVLAPDGTVTAHGDIAGQPGRAALETGVLALRATAFDGQSVGAECSLTRHLFAALLRTGRLGGMLQTAPFFDIGTPERYRRFCAHARTGAAKPLSELDF